MENELFFSSFSITQKRWGKFNVGQQLKPLTTGKQKISLLTHGEVKKKKNLVKSPMYSSSPQQGESGSNHSPLLM